jgi:hypothetical protein
VKVQVTTARAGLPSEKQVKELGLFYSSKWFISGQSKVSKWNATLMDKLEHWKNNHVWFETLHFWPMTWNVPSCFIFRGTEGG